MLISIRSVGNHFKKTFYVKIYVKRDFPGKSKGKISKNIYYILLVIFLLKIDLNNRSDIKNILQFMSKIMAQKQSTKSENP